MSRPVAGVKLTDSWAEWRARLPHEVTVFYKRPQNAEIISLLLETVSFINPTIYIYIYIYINIYIYIYIYNFQDRKPIQAFHA